MSAAQETEASVALTLSAITQLEDTIALATLATSWWMGAVSISVGELYCFSWAFRCVVLLSKKG